MVRKNQRKPHKKFDALDSALQLTVHTLKITANEKIFNPSHRSTIDRIGNEAVMIYHNCHTANHVPVKAGDYESANERLGLQREAIDLCKHLKADIVISQSLFHLKSGKVHHWNKLANDAMYKIKAWHNSDKARYNLDEKIVPIEALRKVG